MNKYDVILAPYFTEKSIKASEDASAFVFKVHPKAGKTEIKDAVESIFEVKVDKIRTLSYKGKRKRFGMRIGKRKDWKKAIVTLAEGHKIEL